MLLYPFHMYSMLSHSVVHTTLHSLSYSSLSSLLFSTSPSLYSCFRIFLVPTPRIFNRFYCSISQLNMITCFIPRIVNNIVYKTMWKLSCNNLWQLPYLCFKVLYGSNLICCQASKLLWINFINWVSASSKWEGLLCAEFWVASLFSHLRLRWSFQPEL
jgi:hypothetical protein